MSENARLLAIVDRDGRVLAAQLHEDHESVSREVPSVGFTLQEGQRVISLEVRREVLELPGPDLHRFFSHVKVRWPADVQVPKIEVVRKHKH